MKTIVILGDAKCKRLIDYLKGLLEENSVVISPFCFIGWQLDYNSQDDAETALKSAYDTLYRDNPDIANTIHLSFNSLAINFECLRAEIIEL